jgi:hypothetical protein
MPKLALKHPLTLGRKILEELIFRDYTVAADYLAFDQRGGVAQNIALIANLCGTDEAVIRQLHGSDYRAATAIADKLMLDDETAAQDGGAEKKSLAS